MAKMPKEKKEKMRARQLTELRQLLDDLEERVAALENK